MADILLVDDNEGVRSSLEVLLKFSHNVISINSGAKAIELIKENKYELIISDVKMPGMSGIELLEELNKLNIKTPVILMSGQLDIDRPLIDELGAIGILDKPFEIAALEKMINETMKIAS